MIYRDCVCPSFCILKGDSALPVIVLHFSVSMKQTGCGYVLAYVAPAQVQPDLCG